MTEHSQHIRIRHLIVGAYAASSTTLCSVSWLFIDKPEDRAARCRALTGAFLLAAAGALDGVELHSLAVSRATCSAHPELTLDVDPSTSFDGPIWTSAA